MARTRHMARTTSSGLGQCCNVVDFISIHTTCLIAKEAIWIRESSNMNHDEGSYQLSHV